MAECLLDRPVETIEDVRKRHARREQEQTTRSDREAAVRQNIRREREREERLARRQKEEQERKGRQEELRALQEVRRIKKRTGRPSRTPDPRTKPAKVRPRPSGACAPSIERGERAVKVQRRGKTQRARQSGALDRQAENRAKRAAAHREEAQKKGAGTRGGGGYCPNYGE